MSAMLLDPFWVVLDADGNTVSGATIETFVSGTNTPLATYSDSDFSTQHTNPIICNASGVSATNVGTASAIYTNSASMKVVIKNAEGEVLRTVDPVLTGAGSTRIVADVGSLRALPTGSVYALTAETVEHTEGYGIAGGGRFVWSATSTATDNNGSVIKPTAIDSADPGRWLLDADEFTAEHFGAPANGTDDDTAAIHASMNAAAAIGGKFRFLGSNYTLATKTALTTGDRTYNSIKLTHRFVKVDNGSITINADAGAKVSIKTLGDPGVMFMFESCVNVLWESTPEMDGNVSTLSIKSYALVFAGVGRVLVDGGHIYKTGGEPISFITDPDAVRCGKTRVANCIIRSCKSTIGVSWKGGSADHAECENVYFEDMAGGVYVECEALHNKITTQSFSASGTTLTVNATAHGLTDGLYVSVSNMADVECNGRWAITVVDENQFTVSVRYEIGTATPTGASIYIWPISNDYYRRDGTIEQLDVRTANVRNIIGRDLDGAKFNNGVTSGAAAHLVSVADGVRSITIEDVHINGVLAASTTQGSAVQLNCGQTGRGIIEAKVSKIFAQDAYSAIQIVVNAGMQDGVMGSFTFDDVEAVRCAYDVWVYANANSTGINDAIKRMVLKNFRSRSSAYAWAGRGVTPAAANFGAPIYVFRARRSWSGADDFASVTSVGTTATFTFNKNHRLAVGDLFTTIDFDAGYNVTNAVVTSVPTTKSLTVTLGGTPATSPSVALGTFTEDKWEPIIESLVIRDMEALTPRRNGFSINDVRDLYLDGVVDGPYDIPLANISNSASNALRVDNLRIGRLELRNSLRTALYIETRADWFADAIVIETVTGTGYYGLQTLADAYANTSTGHIGYFKAYDTDGEGLRANSTAYLAIRDLDISLCGASDTTYFFTSSMPTRFTTEFASGDALNANLTWTPGSIATLTHVVSSSVTINGAQVGDLIDVEPASAPGALMIWGEVTAANTAVAHIFNPSSGSLSGPSTLYRLRCRKNQR